MNCSVMFNGKEVKIFPGMKVRHLLSSEQMAGVMSRKKDMFDKYGNIIGLDGELSSGMELFLKPVK